MKHTKRLTLSFMAMMMTISVLGLHAPKDKDVVVHVKTDGKADVSDALQRIIDSNPNRTIYFPDGVYLISKPILTPAYPSKSVALELSNYAIIKAAAN